MTITYLIGNGFDIGLKLKSDYKSFMDWYLARSDIASGMEWVRQEMRSHPNQWSDAEIAFGKLKFAEHGENSVAIYNRCYDDFTEAFNSYLVERNKLFSIPVSERQKVAERFLRHIIRIDDYMSAQCRQYYADQMNVQSVELNFITFNYTDTLEQILNFHSGQTNEHEIQLVDNKPLKVIVKNICHVHGTLDDAYVFGVDVPGQIDDQEVRRYCERNGGMLKARADEKLGLLNRKKGVDIINRSNRIITYGLSFGISDTSWWQVLFNAIFSKGKQLVICPFRTDLPERLSAKKRGDVYLEEKRRVFNSLISADPKLALRIEEVNPPTIISLRPSKVPDGLGKVHSCDYFRLSAIAAKYTNEKV